MICDYDGREIEGEPFKVKMGKATEPTGSGSPDSEIGYRYFHDNDCYELFVADEVEYETLDLPGGQVS